MLFAGGAPEALSGHGLLRVTPQARPDVLLLPSDLAPFAKETEKLIAENQALKKEVARLKADYEAALQGGVTVINNDYVYTAAQQYSARRGVEHPGLTALMHIAEPAQPEVPPATLTLIAVAAGLPAAFARGVRRSRLNCVTAHPRARHGVHAPRMRA